MGFDVYHRREIANVLRATACASEGSAGLALGLLSEPELSSPGLSQERLLQAYRQGVAHALVSVGLALGLEPVGLREAPKSGALPALAGLLWAETSYER